MQGDRDVTTKPEERQPMAVPLQAKRIGEAPCRWQWVEPRVWTERMLAALEQGVKGGKWFTLIDKVHPERTLQAAFSRVATSRSLGTSRFRASTS